MPDSGEHTFDSHGGLVVTNLASDIALTAQDVLVFVARVQRAQFDVDAATGIDIISALGGMGRGSSFRLACANGA